LYIIFDEPEITKKNFLEAIIATIKQQNTDDDLLDKKITTLSYDTIKSYDKGEIKDLLEKLNLDKFKDKFYNKEDHKSGGSIKTKKTIKKY
jgi:hypothetical protein